MSRDGERALVRLSRLLQEARVERRALDRISRELGEVRRDLDADPSRPNLALCAVDLHDYSTAVETLFARIARAVDGDVPAGAGAHRALIEQMAAELPTLRPAVLADDDLRAWLHRLRGFRHFFRHAYDVPLDPEQLRAQTDELLARHPSLVRALDTFLDHVTRSRDALIP